ncbi:MAG: LytR/AlgR family response regulator transcription factor [Alphaproteobacteria bacterium]
MNILIVEDEAVIARRLERLLLACLNGEGQCRIAGCLEEARALAGEDLDLVFLDLNLDGRDGFELLRESVSRPWHTVVVSAHTERALEAFELGVLDFVPKPFTGARLRQSLMRARKAPGARGRANVLFVRTHRGIETVRVQEIVSIAAAGDYSELRLAGGRRLLHDKSLTRLEQVLPGDFLRVHRAHIANMRFFTRTRGSGELELGPDTVLPVSRRRFARLQEWLRGAF